MGLDKLIDLIIDLWDNLVPWYIVDEYENCVLLFCGKFRKVIGPGLHLKCPFLHSPIIMSVVMTTMKMDSQSVTTKDMKSVVVGGIVKYSIDDLKPLILEIGDSIDAIADVTTGKIRHVISERTWCDIIENNNLELEITKMVRNEVKKWGVKIHRVVLKDLQVAPSLRILGDEGDVHNWEEYI